jgi:serine/threonine protein kinase
MPLAHGTLLGPYEIVALIGEGGMGEVYRAIDPRLGRDVAIKVSAAQFTERFEREARAVAALNHPNICTLYDIGPNYLVMELIEGQSLQGPLPLQIALNYARQIANALEAAHEKGIVHRDLKPANIKVKPDGTVKVLDFGLAKMAEPIPGNQNPQNSPTLTISATHVGMILGTASYMSPEQARGDAVDQRADIWAFGVVLYEMLVGKRMFEARTVSDTLAAVLVKEPDLSLTPAHKPRPQCRRADASAPPAGVHRERSWHRVRTGSCLREAKSGSASPGFKPALYGGGKQHQQYLNREPLQCAAGHGQRDQCRGSAFQKRSRVELQLQRAAGGFRHGGAGGVCWEPGQASSIERRLQPRHSRCAADHRLYQHQLK